MFAPRDMVLATAGGAKGRHSVVIRISADGSIVLIAYGTGSDGYDIPSVMVDPDKRAGKSLSRILTKPTFFYQNNIIKRHVSEVKYHDKPAIFPWVFWTQLQDLVEARCCDEHENARLDLREWTLNPTGK
jgi:hypothetical protein